MPATIGRWFVGSVGILLAAACSGHAGEAAAGAELAPNGQFRQADPQAADQPLAWRLSGGQGRWADRETLEVTGNGTEGGSNSWNSTGIALAPGKLYRFEMRARRAGGAGGSAVSGPTFANRDRHDLSDQWKTVGHVFRVPDGVQTTTLRVGQWNAAGAWQFDSVRLAPVLPVHKAVGNLVLGEGESIRDGRYRFRGGFGHPGSNYHRTLLRTTTGLNSDRWTFSTGSEVVYRFEVPGCRFKDGRIGLNVNHYVRGACLAEVSSDGNTWQPVIEQGRLGSAEGKLPAAMFPAQTVLLRLRAQGESSFQVNRVEMEGALDGAAPNGSGETLYAELEAARGDFSLEQLLLRDAAEGVGARLQAVVRNTGTGPARVVLGGKAGLKNGPAVNLPPHEVEIGPGLLKTLDIDLPGGEAGEHVMELSLASPAPAAGVVRAMLAFEVPDYYRADYGELLGRGGDGTAVWWCEATRKIPRTRALPAVSGKAARLAAARNDWEAVQIVLRPQTDLKGLKAAASPLRQVGGSGLIGAEAIRVLRVYYHFVDHPTDSTGVRDFWPDALPPIDRPIDVEAGKNQPLWILVHVPETAAPGDYEGTIELTAEGFSQTARLVLHVWDFALPKRNHLSTAFGMSAGTIFQYHGLASEADKRKVLDLYLKSFSEHRISPYDPAPLDPIRVKFLPQADPPRAEVDFTAFDKAMERAVAEYGFTSFRLAIQGMGGGTFHARHDPEIAGFGENTPEYQAMFASQVRQIESHLREKGWLEMAYVYWFDEPDPKDYEFVANGMKRLEKYAPGLARMITEQPSDQFDAHVNIWCPVSPNYSHQAAEARREHGERFWWYVCTGPKAPYCTLFIDHPATELRVWHWQTWQRKIVGTLVWQSNYWTSSAAFPDQPQNPYEDPMGYVSGYSTGRGVKAFWGNGDGRFIYPPLAAATPSKAPVLEPPVSSIRWEMLREGVEDYEYLYRLRELLAAKGNKLPDGRRAELQGLLAVPESITKDMTTFTTDPRPIHERRREIAEAIEELDRK